MSVSNQVELGLLNRLAPRLHRDPRPAGPRSLVVPGLDRPSGGVPVLVWEEPQADRVPHVVLRVGVEEDVDTGQHADDAPLDQELGSEAGPEGGFWPAAVSSVDRPDAPRVACELEVVSADLDSGRAILDRVKLILPRRFALRIVDAEGVSQDLDAWRDGAISLFAEPATATAGNPGTRRFRWTLRYVVEAYEERLAEAQVMATVRVAEVPFGSPDALPEVLEFTPEDDY